MANSYVLFDLDTIKVNTRTINNKPTVFCESITIKQRDQDIKSIEDWSNIIIGDPNITRNIGENGTITINISNLVENNGEYSVDVNSGIGLWSVILFKTITDATGKYTTLYNIADESANIGGTGIQGTNIEVIYESDPTYTNNVCVNNFLENVFNNRDDYNGCMFINNDNCGLFLNISPIMFNTQSNLKDIALTNTITYIDSNKSFAAVGVFSDCINLESANIPKYLDNYFEYNDKNNSYTKPKISRVIPTYYFYNCKKLNNISIPDGIHNIEYAAFYGCDKVETINIPASVTSLGSLSLVTVNRLDKRYININGDINNPTNITFYEQSVGYDKLNANSDKPYSANDIIIKINGRREVKLSGASTHENSSFVKNTSNNSEIYINCETISGTTLITNNQGQQKYGGGFVNTNFKTIYIGPRVTSICNFAFYNVIGTNLIIDNGSILADDYVDNSKEDSLEVNKYQDGTYLIKTPFAKSNFNSIHILNCTSIGQYALHSLYTPELKFFELNYNYVLNNNTYKNTTALESLGEYAFYNSQFGRIIISRDVNSISNTAFLQTKGSLELKCDISGYTTDVDSNGHKHTGILVNSGFSEINFNYANNGIIPSNILYENKSIKSIKLGEYIKNIYANAFYLCTNLTGTLSLPASIESISETSFIGCTFSGFTSSSNKYQIGNDGMYLLTDNGSDIVLFANKHPNIQITDNTFNIDIKTVNKICGYAFAYAFSDYGKSNVYAVTIPQNITEFGRNVFYNCQKITRITFYPDNIAKFTDELTSPIDIEVNGVNLTTISVEGSFSDLPLLKDVYIGYATGILLLNSIPTGSVDNRNNFLYNTIRNSYTNNVSNISNITIYVYEELVENYTKSAWGLANYKISGIAKDVPPPPPVPPTGNDDSYDADIDDPEGEEWPNDGGNGNISNEEDYIPPVDDTPTKEENNNWIVPSDNNVFTVTIKQLGTPAINVYGCRLDLLNPSYLDGHEPLTTPQIIDQFGNIDFSALDYLKFNKVSNETHYGSDNDDMLKLYMGDYGNNFLIVFTVTGIDNFDATTKLFTSGVEYATHRESNWLKTEIVRITKNQESGVYYVVLLCTCLKLQNKDNYNCRTAIVSVNYGSQILDSNIKNPEQITTKIKIIQHKTELRLSNDTREINITDLPVLFCQQDERAEFIGNFFIGFPKNFWGNGKTIENTQKLREYINDYFRILYDKEKIQIIGQVITIDEIEYTYTFDVAEQKYANIKAAGSTTGVLKTFDSCDDKELDGIHEEYYYVNFKIKNKKTSLAGGIWNISIYNIGEPAEMLNIHVIEDKTDIPSISVMFEGTFDVENYEGTNVDGTYNFTNAELNTNMCYAIDDLRSVRMKLALPTVVAGIPTYKKDGVMHKIYPSEELIDLCVDNSVVNMCGLSVLGNNTGNVYNAFTTQINKTPINLGISSNSILSSSLNNIKFVSSGSVKQSLYNYKISNANITNRFGILQTCSRKDLLIKTQRMGDSSNEILENTETYIYLIDTGYSSLKASDTSVYYNYLCTDQGRQTDEISLGGVTSLRNETTLNSYSVEDKLEETIYHNENSETGVYIEANNVLTDTYYNVLAPLYKYVYVNTYNGAETIDINENVKLDREKAYFCTPYSSYCVVDDHNKLYILKGASDSKDNIEIWDNVNKRYKHGHLKYQLDENINAYQLYKYTIDGVDNNNFEISVSPSCGNKIEDPNYFNTIIGETSVKEQSVIKIGLEIKYNCNIDISNKTVYKVVNDDNIDFRDTGTGKLIDDIIRDAINKSPINIKEVKTHCYFIYIGDNPEITDDGYIRADNGGGSQVLDKNKIKVVNDNSSGGNDKYIIYKYSSGWYQIYNASDVHVTYNATPDANGNLNDAATAFYKNRDINQIRDNMVANINIDESKQLEANKIDIIPTELKKIHPSLFRQIFYHLYYEIDDNGKKIKVYDDNNKNAIIHLRFMYNYDYSGDKPFIISNLFGITLPEFNAVDTGWQKPTITIGGKPQMVP